MASTFDFDLDRATAQAWAQFTERLADVLSMMDETAPLTLSTAKLSDEVHVPEVSFHITGPGVIEARATGNGRLDEQFQLNQTQIDQLRALGWTEGCHPDVLCASRSQEESDHLAGLAVSALRDVYGVQHPVFLAPDQLAEVLTPTVEDEARATTEFDAEDVVATLPVNREHLEQLVETELLDILGYPPIRDDAGDLAIRVGSSMVFVRVSDDGREVLVFATLVHDLAGRSRAAEVLNDLNCEARWVRFELRRDLVFCAYTLLAHPFVPAHLHQVIKQVTAVADSIDDDLALKLGGRTTFPDEGSAH